MLPCKMGVKGSNIPYLNRTGLPATESTKLINFATQQHHEKEVFDTQQKSQTTPWLEGKKSTSANSCIPHPSPGCSSTSRRPLGTYTMTMTKNGTYQA